MREIEMQKNQNLKTIQKAQNGITLVALVITIIVIIILSTVAINFVFGDNGLIRQAEQAKDYYANDTEYTDDSLTNVDSYIDEIVNGEKNTLVGHVKWVGENGEQYNILDDRGNLYSISREYEKAKIEDLQLELTNVAIMTGDIAVTNDNKILLRENDGKWQEVPVIGEFPGALIIESGLILDKEGYIWQISDNGYEKDTDIPSILPSQDMKIREIKIIDDNVIAIDANGQLWIQENANYELTPITSIDKKIIDVQIIGNGSFIIALDEDGYIWAWGNGFDSNTPQKVTWVDKKIVDFIFDFTFGKIVGLDEEGNVWRFDMSHNVEKIEFDVRIEKINFTEKYIIGVDQEENVWGYDVFTEEKENLSNLNEEENWFYGEKIKDVYYNEMELLFVYLNDEYIIFEEMLV